MVQIQHHCGTAIFFRFETDTTLSQLMSKKTFKISAEVQGSKGVIRISGEITSWENHAEGFRDQLKSLTDAGINDLVVYLNTPGGSCFQANQIVNELSVFKGKKVGELGAICASAGTYIASKLDWVRGAKNTNYMIHKPWGVIEGNAAEIESKMKLLKNLEADYAKTYSEKTGLPIDKIEEMWVADYWMNAEEAKKLGFIDEIDGEEQAITDEDIEALQASGYKNMPNITATLKNEDKMKEKLILILAGMHGISVNASSSDAEIVAAVEALKTRAAKHDDINSRYEQLVKETNKAKVDAVLAKGKDKKQITDAQTAFYRKRLEENFEETKAHIEALPEVKQLSRESGNGGQGGQGGEDRTNWTYDKWQTEDPKGLQEMAKNEPERFEKMFNAYYNTGK